MDKKSEKTFDPFLYPFRRKSHIFNEIAMGNVFPYWSRQHLNGNIMKQFETPLRNEHSPLQMKLLNLGMTSDMNTFAATANRAPLDISYTWPKFIDMNHERPEHKDISNQSPTPTEISSDMPKSTVISPDRPISTDISFRKPIPKDVSLTRVDLTQARLDMVPLRFKVAMGVASGMVATTVVHPLDVIKVRLQLFPKKIATVTMLRRIMVCEGARGLYAGLTAGLLRQLTYTGTRLYVYNTLFDKYRRDYDNNPNFRERLRIAVAAGLVGAFSGTPSEVALVRMIEVRRLRRSPCSPPCSFACKHVQNPESAIPQLIRIARREGIKTWWRGGVPTLIRSVFVTTAQVGVYYEIKRALERDGNIAAGLRLHVCTAVCSSLVSAALSLPVDQVKTRYQSFREKQNHVDILKDMLKKKGVKYLWKGFLPYYVRQAVHTMVTYALLDQFIDAYVRFQEVVKKK